MGIAFVNPYLLLLLLALPAIWFFPGARKDWRHSLIRSALVALLVAAMARPVAVTQTEEVHYAFILDSSASASTHAEAAGAALRRLLETLPLDATASLVQLGRQDVSSLQADFSQLKLVRRLELAGGQSSISLGLETIGQLIPAKSRASVTIISDGLATDDRWGKPLQALSERGIPIHSVVIPINDNDVYPVAIQAQQAIRVGETARIRVGIVGTAAETSILLKAGNKILSRLDGVPLQGRSNVVLEFEPERSGFLELKAELVVRSGADDNLKNNQLSRHFAVQSPLRVLYAGKRVTGAREKFEQLVGRGFDFVDVSTLVESEQDLATALGEFDAVVLDDVPASSLPADFQQSLVKAVAQNGVGLMMTGGQGAFGPGGFHKTPIAKTLPVEFIQKEEKRDPSTTLVVIIDTSGSMTGQRVQLAKEVARLSIRRLLPHDKVGIVEFYGAKRWAAPIQPASNSIELQRAINRLDAGGGTVILPAIEESFYALQNVQTRYKHVLVLTDGGVEQGAFESLLRKMAEKGINVSTVLIGGDTHSEFLVNIANWGKGRFYSASNRFSLPEVILKQPTTARIPAYRPGRHVVTAHGGPGWWGSVDRKSIPPLAGYVETRSRPQAHTLIKTQEGQHPVLATWRYGLGRVTTFASEPTGPGTESWRGWQPYGSLMARVIRRTARTHTLPFEFEVERVDDLLHVTATRLVDLPVKPQLRLIMNGGSQNRVTATAFPADDMKTGTSLKFRQLTPRRFRATIYAKPGEAARFQAGVQGQPGSRWQLVSAPMDDVAPETQVDPQRAVAFAQWAADTGGTSVTLGSGDALQLTVGGSDKTLAVHKIWPYLFLLALLFYFADLLYRRWPRRMAV